MSRTETETTIRNAYRAIRKAQHNTQNLTANEVALIDAACEALRIAADKIDATDRARYIAARGGK